MYKVLGIVSEFQTIFSPLAKILHPFFFAFLLHALIAFFSETLKERRKKLEALRELERQKEAEFLESQRRGRRPGTGGDGGGGVRDSGGPTGGYSYDSGGRQGFGYGLRDGGLASLAPGRG